jgi:hypothetical protein
MMTESDPEDSVYVLDVDEKEKETRP